MNRITSGNTAKIVRTPNILAHMFVSTALAGLLLVAGPIPLRADDCPPERPMHLPELQGPKDNINSYKVQLKGYKDGEYMRDIQLVLDDALAYVMSRAGKVERPAVVLDIDETSLSNWKNLEADDFGFIPRGECSMVAGYPCGFAAWINRAEAEAIPPTLKFYDAVRSKNIAVFFITGRTVSQGKVTILNLQREGFKDWSGLRLRPDGDKGSIVPFKSGERARLESGDKPYHIIATIGDQTTDLIGNSNGGDTGRHAECGFKLPNPFYLIP